MKDNETNVLVKQGFLEDSAHREYEPYRFVDTKEEFEEAVASM